MEGGLTMPCERKHVEAIENAWYADLDLDDALSAALAACDESPWRSMESAPKYTEVQLWRDDAGAMYGIFCSPEHFLDDQEIERLYADCLDAAEVENWWAFGAGGAEMLDGTEVPTHWMPLPAAPEVGNV
jgi:hypothetical protein